MLFARRNRREAFEKLAEQVFPSVFGTALRLTRSREDAEDLSQEAIVRAFDAFDRFDGTNFKAWILRIVTNLYINRYRQRQRGPQMASFEDENVYEPVADEGQAVLLLIPAGKGEHAYEPRDSLLDTPFKWFVVVPDEFEVHSNEDFAHRWFRLWLLVQ